MNEHSQSDQSILNSALERGSIDCFVIEEDDYRKIEWDAAIQKTSREILEGPYLFRIFVPEWGNIYFVEDKRVFSRLLKQGKQVRLLHELFEFWRNGLIRKGLPPETSIHWWPLDEIGYWLDNFQPTPVIGSSHPEHTIGSGENYDQSNDTISSKLNK